MVTSAALEAIEAVKPRLRGWLHAGTFPLALAAGVVLVALSPTGPARVTTAIFSVTVVLLLGVSATFHRGCWSPRVHRVLRRLDHASIFLVIAGTYTPFCVLLLHAHTAKVLLSIVWVGALLGIAFRALWVGAPRWLYTPVYVVLGWVAVVFSGQFLTRGGVAVVVLIAIGGLLYSAGALVYAMRRPNPSPRWFGFHEVFHALTLAAFAVHYVAVSMVAYRA